MVGFGHNTPAFISDSYYIIYISTVSSYLLYFADTAACTLMDSTFDNSKSNDSVVPTIAGILVTAVVLVVIAATVIGVIIW